MKEKGFVMVLCLLMLVFVTLLGIAGMQTATFGTIISGIGLEGQKAFWIAESGLQDAKDNLDQATSVEAFRNIPGLSSPVSYGGGTYTITAATDPYDSTRRVVVTSVGSRPEAKKIVEATLVKFTFEGPGALYSKSLVKLNADHTLIVGKDACGGTDKPAIVTWQGVPVQPPIDFQNGELYGKSYSDMVKAQGGTLTGGNLDDVTETNSAKNYPLKQYVDAYKNYATVISFDFSIQGNHLPDGSGGYSQNAWGGNEITQGSCQACYGGVPPLSLIGNPTPNIIYLNPQNGQKEVTLSGQVNGHGLLIVDGTLNISGGFNWYGLVIATGGLKFTGQGGEGKNITGAVMAGEIVDVTVFMNGSIAIIYCSAVTNYLRDLTTAIMISWREIRN